jgi:chromosome partitioning protein
MRIVFGNQKGGAGKSTLCALLANYLAIEKQVPVLVLDMDTQQSLRSMRERDLMVQTEMPYQIETMQTEEYAKYRQEFANKDIYILMDLPGTLDDEHLKAIIQDADYIICPFRYDFVSFVSTLDFTDVVESYIPKRTQNKEDREDKGHKDKAKKTIFYVPNMVKANVTYEQQQRANEMLSEKGVVTTPISDRVTLQRLQTYAITSEQKGIVETVFDFIYEAMNEPEPRV